MKKWWSLFARLVVGGVWLVAGAIKLPDPAASVRAVRAYRILPDELAQAIGSLLPVLEVVLGLCLIIGLLVRPMAVLSVVLFALFIAAIASVWIRGVNIDCGCFGGGGAVAAGETAYGTEIARDVALLVMSASLVMWPSRWLAADSLLFAPKERNVKKELPAGS